MSYTTETVDAAVSQVLSEHLRDGMTIAVGDFGLYGVPFDLIEAVRDSGVTGLTIVSNDVDTPGVYVTHVVRASDRVKDIEQRTVRPRPPAPVTPLTPEEWREAVLSTFDGTPHAVDA